jgi:hypothetical protein
LVARLGGWQVHIRSPSVRSGRQVVFRAPGATLFFHMSVLFTTDAPFWCSGLGAGKFTLGALRTEEADFQKKAHGATPPFSHVGYVSNWCPLLVARLGGWQVNIRNPSNRRGRTNVLGLMGPPPFFHMPVLFQIGAPLWWSGLGLGGFRLGFGFRIKVSDLGFGLGFKVSGLGLRFRFRVWG